MTEEATHIPLEEAEQIFSDFIDRHEGDPHMRHVVDNVRQNVIPGMARQAVSGKITLRHFGEAAANVVDDSVLPLVRSRLAARRSRALSNG